MSPEQPARFLITRPEHQASKLIDLIRKQGGTATAFPVIEVLDKDLKKEEIEIIKNIDNFDTLIFISANAVHKSMALVEQYRGRHKINAKIVVIGPATRAALAEYGIDTDIISRGKFSSEGLLKHQDLHNVEGNRILILRGEGGRELLADTLSLRGAEVKSLATYRRKIPKTDSIPLVQRVKNNEIDVIAVMSNESLHNLCTIIGDDYLQYLLKVKLVVISERCHKLAGEIGFKTAIIAESPSDEHVCTSLFCAYNI